MQNQALYSSNKAQSWVLLIASVIFISLGVFLLQNDSAWRGGEQAIYISALLYLFVVSGIWGIYLALSSFYSRMRLGKMPLYLEPSPGSIGGDIAGTIHCNLPMQTLKKQPIEIALNCMEERHGSDDVSIFPKWQKNGYARVQKLSSHDGASQLAFCFKDIPSDLPASYSAADEHQSRAEAAQKRSVNYYSYYWVIELIFPKSISQLSYTYKIPVSKEVRAKSSYDFDSSNLPEYASEFDLKSALPFIDSHTYVYGYLKAGKMSWVTLFGGLLFTVMGLFMLFLSLGESIDDKIILLAIGGVCTLLGLPFTIFGALDVCSKTVVKLSQQSFYYNRKFLGFNWLDIKTEYKDIIAVDKKNSGQCKHPAGWLRTVSQCYCRSTRC